MKTCSHCSQKLPFDRFYKRSDGRGLYTSWCRRCIIEKSKIKNAGRAEYFKRYRSTGSQREHIRVYGKNYRQKSRELVLLHYSNNTRACVCCYEKIDEFLSIDHINSDGAAHRKTVSGLYSWLVRKGFPKGFRVLCMNCNWGRRRTGTCPHEIKPEVAK